MNIDEIISNEEKALANTSDYGAISILYNLIHLTYNYNKRERIYIYVKKFINSYIQVAKSESYGYDKLNFSKIEKVIGCLTYQEQISIWEYTISFLAREIPEYDRAWFIHQRYKSEIKLIFKERKYFQYPKALLLLSSINSTGLIFSVLLFFLLTIIFLLPAKISGFEFFRITYHSYSDLFFVNHILNVISFFIGIDNEFKVEPTNYKGIILFGICKLFFVLIIVNFLYRKVIDKISRI